jgi:molecular chaperone GrpE
MTRTKHHARESAPEERAEGTPIPEDAARREPRPPEPCAPADAPVSPDDQGTDIEGRIAEIEQELAEERGRALRVLADFQNYRRRNEEQRNETIRYAVQEFAIQLLPVLDNLQRALGAAPEAGSFEALLAGVELTHRQILGVLARHGIEPIAALGQEFDPNLHEAVMRVEDSEAPENTVVEEMRRGYTMHARVIRPTMVKVAARP